MGWLVGWDSKKELVRHLDHNIETGGNIKLLASSTFGWTEHYQLIEVDSKKDGKFVTIMVNLLTSHTEYKRKRWGYKDMDLSAGPYVWNAPKYMVDQVTDTSENALDWIRVWKKRKEAAKFDRAVVRSLQYGQKISRQGHDTGFTFLGMWGRDWMVLRPDGETTPYRYKIRNMEGTMLLLEETS